MPIYEYTCQDCDTGFEVLVRGNKVAACPDCGSQSLNKLPSAPFFVSRRSAWQPGCSSCAQEEHCVTNPRVDGDTCLAR